MAADPEGPAAGTTVPWTRLPLAWNETPVNRLRRLFHRHRWTNLAINQGTNGLNHAVTVLLRRCATCGKHDTETLNGHWSAALFEPPTSTNQGD